jgi:hypothetical protein
MLVGAADLLTLEQDLIQQAQVAQVVVVQVVQVVQELQGLLI